MHDLSRFTIAQDTKDAGFAQALREIRSGRKRGHWIWYVFPQLAGLGTSSMSQTYAIRNAVEAGDYLRDPILGPRLLEITTEVRDQLRKGVDLSTLMGSPIDAQKLVSSLTLFASVVRALPATDANDSLTPLSAVADEVLSIAEAQGYPRCRFTLDRLR